MKYIILSLADAKWIAANLPEGRIRDRLKSEEGANIEEIRDDLKKMDFCPACVIEMQQHTCSSLYAAKLGRRLGRLIERANGERL